MSLDRESMTVHSVDRPSEYSFFKRQLAVSISAWRTIYHSSHLVSCFITIDLYSVWHSMRSHTSCTFICIDVCVTLWEGVRCSEASRSLSLEDLPDDRASQTASSDEVLRNAFW